MAKPEPPPDEGGPPPSKGAVRPGSRRRGRTAEKRFTLGEASAEVLDQLGLQSEFRIAETEDDARLRRKKDLLGYLVKDLAVYVLGLLIVGGTVCFCFAVFLNSKSPPESQQRAWTALTAILTGIVGFIFGKAAGK